MAVTLGKAARKWAGVLIVALSSLVSTSFASPVISYSTSNPSGNNWVYQYTVSNPAPSDPISEFTIWFDRAQYANLSVIGSPADWDSIVIQHDLSIPADGFFDALALGSGVGVGATLTGFSVGFTYLNGDTPGAQAFEIINPSTFQTTFGGTTVLADSGPGGGGTNPVDAPSTLALLAFIFLGLKMFGPTIRRSKQ
jgi:hypothetical protein